MKPICVPCQRFFRPKKTGFQFIEGMPKPGMVEPLRRGTEKPEEWEPYKIWSGDLWECRGCGAQIVSGFGASPLFEHYQDNFKEHVRRLGKEALQVNDC